MTAESGDAVGEPTGPTRVGVIGVGRMGRPIVDRLVATGYQPTVLTRRPSARAEAEAAGLRCADTVRETVRDAQVVLTVVFDDEQLRATALGPGGLIAAMPAGAILVQHTTCDPATMTLLAETAADRGIRVLDAALSGNPRDIAAGRLTVWAGGEEQALAEVRPLLDCYASPVMAAGPVGNGQRIKLINNALFVAQVGLTVDAVRLAASMGIAEEQILAAVAQGSGASRALSSVAWIGADAVGTRLGELMSKDVRVVRAVAQRAGSDLGLIGQVLGSAVVERQVLGGAAAAPPGREQAAQSRGLPGPMKESLRQRALTRRVPSAARPASGRSAWPPRGVRAGQCSAR